MPPHPPRLSVPLAICPPPKEGLHYSLTTQEIDLETGSSTEERVKSFLSIFQVWDEQIELLHLLPPPPPSGELIPALETLIPQEGWWLLLRASCLHTALECLVSVFPIWGLLPVSMSSEAAHVGLE